MFGNLEGIQEMSETLRMVFNDVFSQWAGQGFSMGEPISAHPGIKLLV